MDIAEFIDARRSKWSALEGLLAAAQQRGIKSLSLDDARHLSRLYRSASSDLLWMRAHGGSAEVTEYLNDLVGRAYALTYPGKKPRAQDVWRFLGTGFPALFRAEWRVFVASALLTFGGAAFGYLGMMFDPAAAYYLVPAEHLKLDPVERAKEEAKNETASADQQAAFASFLFTHNIQVAIFAFALGVSAGVGTALALFANGIMLGALAQVYAAKGMAGWFWAWILPHGIPELTAICIAGAAGLILARGMLAPRGLPRRVALRREGKRALLLLLGTFALFVLAGIIEGTISQIHPPKLPVWFKITFALVVGGGVYLYLFSAWLRKDTSAIVPPS
ncbi:MAG: stage II sporulation protein M [Myxococcaceae bacterium]|nr:stage II sporulation protein M [Myxococcaceae bacterium]